MSVHQVSFGYAGNSPVVRDLSLGIAPGTTVCLTGDNGSGKSTLLKLMIGELPPQSGTISVHGRDVSRPSHLDDVGYVPQNNVISKTSFPITAREIVVQGLSREFGFIKIPRKRYYQRAEEALHSMGLEQFIHTPFGALSGGLQQRVMITRSLIHNPSLLFLDDPIAGVDKENREDFLHLLGRLAEQRELTTVLVTHSVDVVQDHLGVDEVLVKTERGIEHA